MPDNPFKIKKDTVKDRAISGYNSNRQQGDNLLFLPSLSGWLGKNLKSRQINLYYVFLIGLFIILLSRLTYLQIVQGSNYYAIAEGNRLKILNLKAPRGIIKDRYGSQLVENHPRFTLYLNPLLIQGDSQAKEVTAYLTDIFPEEEESLAHFATNYRSLDREVKFADEIDYEEALQLMIKSTDIAAIQVAYEPKRTYLYDYGLAHILGYVGKITYEELNLNIDYDFNDVIGKSGIEKQYERILRGVDGSHILETDALGREKDAIAYINPVKGDDIYLAIDLQMQNKLNTILTDITDQYNKPAAVGIIMNPYSGEIMAMTSVPSYDPNLFSDPLLNEKYEELVSNQRKPFFSRFLAGEYPPGSIFKLTVSIAALEEELISDRFTINSTGGLYLGGRFFPDWRPSGHGRTNIYKALSDSVNTFFYIVGGGYENIPGLGVDLIRKYAGLMGFGKKSGIDLPGEASGFVPSRQWKESTGERWYQGDTYNLSIGQGALLVTPIQVTKYMAFFANGGTIIQPRLLISSNLADGNSANFDPSMDSDYIIGQNTINIVRQGLREAVTDGTARIMQTIPTTVAGKTGTAQFNNNKSPHSWFSGFAPYDKPGIVLTILIEEGADNNLALRAAYQYLSWHFTNYQT